MGTPYHGRGLFFGMVAESTWGTAVSPRTNFLRLRGGDLKNDITIAAPGHLGTVGGGSANRRSLQHLERRAGGYIEWEASYNDSTGFLLSQALGASSFSTSGSGTFTHTGTNKEALPVGFTGHLGRGNGGGQTFEGCLVDKFAFRCTAGGVATCRADLIAEIGVAPGSADSPTFSSGGVPVLYHQASNLVWSAASLDARAIDMEVTIDNKLDAYLEMGSDLIAKPVRGDFQEILMRVTRPWDANVEHVAYLAQTQGDVALTFTGASPLSMRFTLHNAELVSNPYQPITVAGKQLQVLQFRALSDGSDEGIEVEIVNANSAVTAN